MQNNQYYKNQISEYHEINAFREECDENDDAYDNAKFFIRTMPNFNDNMIKDAKIRYCYITLLKIQDAIKTLKSLEVLDY